MLSVAAVLSHGLQTPILPNRNFHGCLENLLYNDLNLIKLAKQNSPQVTAVVSYCVSIFFYLHCVICHLEFDRMTSRLCLHFHDITVSDSYFKMIWH
ncbi:hypothetical protein XENOCAPTIV_009231 [Xenoophorus captivus]|uniref:Uncharacterized protein n=1 Tax=Xenoophorus captivus TaxID=1517983 RepID=A0ABV0QA06_9TELE